MLGRRIHRFVGASCVVALSACAAYVEDSEGIAGAEQPLANKNGHYKAWPMAAYDEIGSSHNASERTIKRQNVTDLSIKWRFDSEDAGHEVGPVHATPVVDNGKVYVGSNLGRFYAIKPNGTMKWSYTARQPNPFLAAVVVPSPIGSPINAVGTPIVGAAVLPPNRPSVIFGDLDGNLYALHRETGRELWVTHANEHPLGGVVGNSLLLVGDTLIVGFASIENLGLVLGDFGYVCCSHRGFVGAYDIDTGVEKWRTYLVEPAGQLDPAFLPYQLGPSGADVWGQPTYDRDTNTVYVGTGQNFSPTAQGGGSRMSDAVVALDLDNGAIRWVYQATENDIWNVGVPSPDATGRYLDQDFGDSPKIYNVSGLGKVIGLGQKSGEYHLIDAETGEQLARTAHVGMANPLGGFQNIGAMAHGTIFQHGLSRLGPVGSQAFNGVIMALSADGAEELWRYEELLSPLAGGLAVANDIVYAVSPGAFPGLGLPEASSLIALDAGSGALLHRVVLEGRALSSPAISQGMIYVGEGNTAVAELGVDETGGVVALGL